jgi:hypothetical protein
MPLVLQSLPSTQSKQVSSIPSAIPRHRNLLTRLDECSKLFVDQFYDLCQVEPDYRQGLVRELIRICPMCNALASASFQSRTYM